MEPICEAGYIFTQDEVNKIEEMLRRSEYVRSKNKAEFQKNIPYINHYAYIIGTQNLSKKFEPEYAENGLWNIDTKTDYLYNVQQFIKIVPKWAYPYYYNKSMETREYLKDYLTESSDSDGSDDSDGSAYSDGSDDFYDTQQDFNDQINHKIIIWECISLHIKTVWNTRYTVLKSILKNKCTNKYIINNIMDYLKYDWC